MRLRLSGLTSQDGLERRRRFREVSKLEMCPTSGLDDVDSARIGLSSLLQVRERLVGLAICNVVVRGWSSRLAVG